MKTTIERESPTKLKLLIEVEPDELKPLYDQTFRRLAKEVNVPGFRKGKAPKAILESRLGKDAIKEEFLKDALPSLYSKATQDEEVRAITLPNIQVQQFDEGQPLSFTATVEVRPEIVLPQYKGIEVPRSGTSPTDEQLDAQLEVLRDRFGTLETVARNAIEGDYLMIDITGYRHDEEIEEASAKDFLYQLGSGLVVPELDEELKDKRAGDILKFNATLTERFGTLAGQEISFSVIVKEVQAKRLPSLDDEFAKTASEFETLDELKEDIRAKLRDLNKIDAEVELRNQILDDLIDRTDVPIPHSMVSVELEHRLTHFLTDIQRAGITMEKYLESQGRSEEELVAAFRRGAEKAVAADLILEAIAKAEGIKVSGEEVDQEVQALAERVGQDADQLRRQLIESDRVLQLAGDILRRKALSFLAEQANVAGEAEISGEKEQ